MLSEGRHEINAIRQRLATANARALSAAKMLDSAQQMLETARQNFECVKEHSDISHEEAKAAEALLKEAEERWKVIDVDAMSAAAPSKRRKVSASPSDVVPVAASADQLSCGTGGVRGASGVTNQSAATIHVSSFDNSGSLEIVVEGCELPEVNGTFKRSGIGCGGSHVYKKTGQWKGAVADYKMYRTIGSWWICVNDRKKWVHLYHNSITGRKAMDEFEDDDDLSEDAAINESVTLEDCHEDAEDLDYDGPNGTSSRRRRPRKRRGYELATKREFEKYSSEWLGRIPGDVKSRFREGGFSKWGKDWVPILELGPFDVEPGPVREMCLEMFRNTQEDGRDMKRLVFWYGVKFENRGQASSYGRAYSFLPETKIVHYEEGRRLGYCKMPGKIKQKIEKGAKLTKTEEQIRRGLIDIESDMMKDKSERIAWIMNWNEDYEWYAEEEAELKAKSTGETPPESGWSMMGEGVFAAPSCRAIP